MVSLHRLSSGSNSHLKKAANFSKSIPYSRHDKKINHVFN